MILRSRIVVAVGLVILFCGTSMALAQGRGGPPAGGPAGLAGLVGPTGPAGADGADGADGATGPAGADGADGADGATGPAGADGADGADGATGPAGADGADGTNGVDGTNGLDGNDGAPGAAGPTGPVGPNYSHVAFHVGQVPAANQNVAGGTFTKVNWTTGGNIDFNDRSGPRNLDSGLSEISIVFQAAVPTLVASKYTTSGVRRPSEL